MADYDVKVRLEGRPEDVLQVSRQLRRMWWVLDESRNYPNRTRAGFVYITYLTGGLHEFSFAS